MRTTPALPFLLLLGALPLAAGMAARSAPAQDALQTSAQEAAPYLATVVVDEASLRSGPGEEDYPVALLQRGEKVEVYKSIRGWCAIRPPEGSFSWVPARQVRVDASGKVGQVTDPKAIAWIGSNLERPAKHLWQVQLQVGEAVAILGEKRFVRKSEGTSETWYKIAPPAGEFRWIQSRFLSKAPEAFPTQIASRESDPSPLTGDASSDASSNTAPAGHTEALPEPAPLPANTSRTPAPITALSSPPKPRKKGFRDVTPGRESLSDFNAPATPSAADAMGDANQRVAFVAPFEQDLSARGAPGAASAPSGPLPSAAGGCDFYAKLADLEAQLGLAVSKPPQDWNLTALRLQALQLTETGPSPLERGRARLLLDRIDLYETHQKQTLELEIARQARNPAAPPAASPPSASLAAPPASGAPAPWKPAEEAPIAANETADSGDPLADQPADAAAPGGNWIDKMKEVVGSGLKGSPAPSAPTHFDAQGKLQRVISDNAAAKFPPFALQDENGRIVAFVGSPVLKLEKYVGKRVGVYGPRGTHTASQTTYIDAVELVELDVASKPMRGTFGTIK